MHPLLLIIAILLNKPTKSSWAGTGVNSGSSNSASTGYGVNTLMVKVIAILAILFMGNSLWINHLVMDYEQGYMLEEEKKTKVK